MRRGQFGRRLFALDLPEPTAQQGDDFLLNLRVVQQTQNRLCLRVWCCSAFLISSSVLVRSSTVRLCPSIEIPKYQYVAD